MTTSSMYLPTYETVFKILLFLFFITLFSLNKQLVNMYYILSLFGAYALMSKKVNVYDIPKEAWIYFSLIILLIIIVTASAVIYNPQSLFRWKYAVYRDLVLLPLVLLAFTASNIRFEFFIKQLVIASLITFLWVAMILIDNPLRLTGWLWHPVERGNIGMLAGVVCMTAFVYFDNVRWKLIAIVGIVGGISLSILSGTRGGWLALFLVTPILLYQLSKTNKAAVKTILTVLVIGLLVVYFLWDKLPIASRVELTINSLQSYMSGEREMTPIGVRFEMWRASWHAFIEKPIFGWGWNNFKTYFLEFESRGIVVASKSMNGHAHNQYFQFLGELGIVGIAGLLAFLMYPVIIFTKKIIHFNKVSNKDAWPICLLVLVVHGAIMVFCLSDSALLQRYFLLLLAITTMISFVLVDREEKEVID